MTKKSVNNSNNQKLSIGLVLLLAVSIFIAIYSYNISRTAYVTVKDIVSSNQYDGKIVTVRGYVSDLDYFAGHSGDNQYWTLVLVSEVYNNEQYHIAVGLINNVVFPRPSLTALNYVEFTGVVHNDLGQSSFPSKWQADCNDIVVLEKINDIRVLQGGT